MSTEPTLEQKLQSEIELFNQVVALEQQAGQERLQRLGRINLLQELIEAEKSATAAEDEGAVDEVPDPS